MTTQMPPVATAYVRSINDHDAAAFNALFAEQAVVDDAGREFRGAASIQQWGDSDIFAPLVTLEVLGIEGNADDVVLTSKVDGNFDRTGLPDPVLIRHHITVQAGKIVSLTCRLASA